MQDIKSPDSRSRVIPYYSIPTGVVEEYEIFDDPVHITKLENGLTLITSYVDRPCTAINIMTLAGADREPRKHCGLAHFTEHMLFEGTSSNSQKAQAQMMNRHGDEYDAATGVESIKGTVTIPNQYVEEALGLLSEMVFKAEMNPERLKVERNVVLREILDVKDEPDEVVRETFYNRTLTRHPTKYPTRGYVSTVKRLGRKHLINFYEQYFVPNNMVLVIVGGGVKGGVTGEIRDLVERLPFGTRKSQAVPKFPWIDEPGTTKKVRYNMIQGLDSIYVHLGVLLRQGNEIIHSNHPDRFVAELTTDLLAASEVSRLKWNAKKQKGYSWDIDADFIDHHDLGIFTVNFSADKDKKGEVLDIVFEELERLKTDLVPEEELRIEKESNISLATIEAMKLDERADDIAEAAAFKKNGLQDLESHVRNICAVTPEQIQAFAIKYFNVDEFAITTVR